MNTGSPQKPASCRSRVNDEAPVLVHFNSGKDNEGDRSWQANVLGGAMSGKAVLRAPAGAARLTLWGADPALVIQRIEITRAD